MTIITAESIHEDPFDDYNLVQSFTRSSILNQPAKQAHEPVRELILKPEPNQQEM